MNLIRRSALAISAASLLSAGLLSAMAGPAVAASSTRTAATPAVAGPFKIGPSNSPSSVALIPNGGRVAVFDIKSGLHGKTEVCLLSSTGRKCSHTAFLSPLGVADVSQTPQVFVLSASHVIVLQYTCCEDNQTGDLLYSSSNGGRSFSAPVRVGDNSQGVFASALIGRYIVFLGNNNNAGARVESIPVTASGPPATVAIANGKTAYDVGVGQYKGGALIGSDTLGSTYATYVEYAARGKDFNASSSYHRVGTFAKEQLIAISGRALLTMRTTGSQPLVLRLFNGRSFGPAHIVPGTSGGGTASFTMNQDPSGRVHVFSERGLVRTYHLMEVSTSTGASWTRPTDLGHAIKSIWFSAAVNSHGRGLVLGTNPALGYPVG
jgi:hypothetical protein